jgi:hypothetical protein
MENWPIARTKDHEGGGRRQQAVGVADRPGRHVAFLGPAERLAGRDRVSRSDCPVGALALRGRACGHRPFARCARRRREPPRRASSLPRRPPRRYKTTLQPHAGIKNKEDGPPRAPPPRPGKTARSSSDRPWCPAGGPCIRSGATRSGRCEEGIASVAMSAVPSRLWLGPRLVLGAPPGPVYLPDLVPKSNRSEPEFGDLIGGDAGAGEPCNDGPEGSFEPRLQKRSAWSSPKTRRRVAAELCGRSWPRMERTSKARPRIPERQTRMRRRVKY